MVIDIIWCRYRQGVDIVGYLSHIQNMAQNYWIDQSSDVNVTMINETDTYIVDAAAETTYTYTLPTPTCDGQQFTIIRIDGTTGIVNLVGTIHINSSLMSPFTVYQYSTVIVVSLNKIWYVICSENVSATSIDPVFCLYLKNEANPYINVSNNQVFSTIPFIGTNNYSTISTVVITFGTATTVSSTIRLLRSNMSTVICTISIPVSSTSAIYNLTTANKAQLTAEVSYIFLQYLGSATSTVSSILFYS